MLPSFRQSVVRRPAAVIIAIAAFETIGVILLLSGVVETRIRGKSVAMKVTCLNPDRFINGRTTRYAFPQSGIEQVTVPEDTKRVFQRAVAEHRLCADITIVCSRRTALQTLLIHE
ncbi:MAG: hypothetical protein RLZZ536_271 [Planctomycetota bacterium]|jgi:hypothetical protein